MKLPTKIKNKTHITQYIGRLREYNYKVFTFQNNRKMRIPIAGIADYLIIGNGLVNFFEAKLKSTKDKLSDDQVEFQKIIKGIENIYGQFSPVRYQILTEENTARVVENLILHSKIWQDAESQPKNIIGDHNVRN